MSTGWFPVPSAILQFGDFVLFIEGEILTAPPWLSLKTSAVRASSESNPTRSNPRQRVDGEKESNHVCKHCKHDRHNGLA